MTSTPIKMCLAAAALGAATFTAPAFAQEPDEVAVATVRYSDLDLSTDRGQDVLQGRLERAARYVCGMDMRFTGSMIASGTARACYVEKMHDFEREIAALVDKDVRRG